MPLGGVSPRKLWAEGFRWIRCWTGLCLRSLGLRGLGPPLGWEGPVYPNLCNCTWGASILMGYISIWYMIRSLLGPSPFSGGAPFRGLDGSVREFADRWSRFWVGCSCPTRGLLVLWGQGLVVPWKIPPRDLLLVIFSFRGGSTIDFPTRCRS